MEMDESPEGDAMSESALHQDVEEHVDNVQNDDDIEGDGEEEGNGEVEENGEEEENSEEKVGEEDNELEEEKSGEEDNELEEEEENDIEVVEIETDEEEEFKEPIGDLSGALRSHFGELGYLDEAIVEATEVAKVAALATATFSEEAEGWADGSLLKKEAEEQGEDNEEGREESKGDVDGDDEESQDNLVVDSEEASEGEVAVDAEDDIVQAEKNEEEINEDQEDVEAEIKDAEENEEEPTPEEENGDGDEEINEKANKNENQNDEVELMEKSMLDFASHAEDDIEKTLRKQLDSLEKLEVHLSEVVADAAKADEAEAEFLSQNGLIVGKTYPLGKSRLRLSSSHLSTFGHDVGRSLLVAREHIERNEDYRARRAGMKESANPFSQIRSEADAPAYLRMTGSLAKRQELQKKRFRPNVRKQKLGSQMSTVDMEMNAAEEYSRSEVPDFISAAQSYADRQLNFLLSDSERMNKMWEKLDFNGNQNVSLAEIDKFITEQAKGDLSMFKGMDNKPALLRAFRKTTMRDGDGDDWLERKEFPMLLRNIYYFNKMWNIFDDIDEDNDHRLDEDEFFAGIQKLGVIISKEEATKEFKAIDTNNGGFILFDEFCIYFAKYSGAVTKGPAMSDSDEEELMERILGVPPKKKKGADKALWQTMMPAHEKHANEERAKKLESKLTYLRNPRNLTNGRCQNEGPPTFRAEPSEMLFDRYEANGHFSKKLLLKNVSNISRRIRLLPPTSEYFSISTITYPGNRGVVAPGMDCTITVHFNPDTRGWYEDVITGISETSEFTIPLRARLRKPILSLPPVFGCGESLLDERKHVSFKFRNTGAHGKFKWLPANRWPDPSPERFIFEDVDADEFSITMGAFTLSPSQFEINAGEEMTLDVAFVADALGNSEEHLVLVCDTCDVAYYTLKGIGCQVQLRVTHLDGKKVESEGNGANNCQGSLFFGKCLPGASRSKQITVQNTNTIGVKYHWEILDRGNDGGIDGIPTFSVAPRRGHLKSKEARTFVFKFCPEEVAAERGDARLVVESVPSRGVSKQNKLGARRSETSDENSEGAILQDVQYIHMELTGTGQPVQISIDPPIITLPSNLPIESAYSCGFRMTNTGNIAAKFNWGNFRRQASVFFEKDGRIPPCTLTLKPMKGNLAPHETITAELSVVGKRSGAFDFVAPLQIEKGPDPYEHLRVIGSISGPKLLFDLPEINFGLVTAGDTIEVTLPFHNASIIPARWRLNVAKILNRNIENSDVVGGSYATVTCEPYEGVLEPNGSGTVKVICKAGTLQEMLRSHISCTVENGESQHISVRADVRHPECHLSCQKIELGNAFVGLPEKRTFTMHNTSPVAAKYRWTEENTKDYSDIYSIKFSSSKGSIPPNSSKDFEITFNPKKMMRVDTLLACDIKGLPYPVGANLTCLVRGLLVSYDIVDEERATVLNAGEGSQHGGSRFDSSGQDEGEEDVDVDRLPTLDFGNEIPLHTRRTMWISVRNHSGIATKFSVNARKFPHSHTDSGPVFKPIERKLKGDVEEVLLHTELLSEKKENERAFQTVEGQKYLAVKRQKREADAALKAGRGIAFMIHPPSGELPAWSARAFQVTCFGDVPKKYRDDLVCSIPGLEPVSLAMRATITGCPLAVEESCVGLDCISSPATLRWPPMPHSLPKDSRTIRIRNNGPLPALLNWQLREGEEEEPIVDVSLSLSDNGTISMVIKEHICQPVPFEVEPASATLKPHSLTEFKILFEPGKEPEASSALMIGTPCWVGEEDTTNDDDDNDDDDDGGGGDNDGKGRKKVEKEKMSKKDGGSEGLIPLKIGLFAETVKTFIDVNKKDRSESSIDAQHALKFIVWCTKNDNHPSMRRTITLTNSTKAPLSFVLDATNPFYVEACKTSHFAEHTLTKPSDRDMGKAKKGLNSMPKNLMNASVTSLRTLSLQHRYEEGKIYTLPLQSSMEVTVGYRWRSEGRLESDLGEDGQPLLQYGDEGRLKISFSNGTVQWIELEADVRRPTVSVTCSRNSQSRDEARNHDFGTCHLTDSIPVSLSIGNPTVVDAAWKVKHIPSVANVGDIVDLPDVFKFGKVAGVLSGPTLPQDSGMVLGRPPKGVSEFIEADGALPTEIQVIFKPEKEERYQSTFRFWVNQGNYYDVTFDGKGTLDEDFLPGARDKL
eukprot:g4113.t1